MSGVTQEAEVAQAIAGGGEAGQMLSRLVNALRSQIDNCRHGALPSDHMGPGFHPFLIGARKCLLAAAPATAAEAAAVGRSLLTLARTCGVDAGSAQRIALCVATDAWMGADLPVCRAMSAAAVVLRAASANGAADFAGARRRLDEGDESLIDMLQRASSTSGRGLRSFLEPLTGCRCFELAGDHPLGLGFPPEAVLGEAEYFEPKRRAAAAFRRGELAEAERLYTALHRVAKNAEEELGARGDIQGLREAAAEKGKIESNLSLLRFKHGDFPAALELAKRCVGTSPAWFRAHHRLGQALAALGRHAEAAAAFANALDAQARDVDVTAAQREATASALHRAEAAAAADAAAQLAGAPTESLPDPHAFVESSGRFAALEGSSVLEHIHAKLHPAELAHLEATCRFFGSAVQGGRENLREPVRRRVRCVPLAGALKAKLQQTLPQEDSADTAVAVGAATDAVQAYCACTDNASQLVRRVVAACGGRRQREGTTAWSRRIAQQWSWVLVGLCCVVSCGAPADLRDEFWQAYQDWRAGAGLSIHDLGAEDDPCAIKWALLANSRLLASGSEPERRSEHLFALMQHIETSCIIPMESLYKDCEGNLDELVSLRCEQVDSLLKGGALVEGVFGALVTLTDGMSGEEAFENTNEAVAMTMQVSNNLLATIGNHIMEQQSFREKIAHGAQIPLVTFFNQLPKAWPLDDDDLHVLRAPPIAGVEALRQYPPSEFVQLFNAEPGLFRRWKFALKRCGPVLAASASWGHKGLLASLGFIFHERSIRLGINAWTFCLFLQLEALRASGAGLLVRKIQSQGGMASFFSRYYSLLGTLRAAFPKVWAWRQRVMGERAAEKRRTG